VLDEFEALGIARAFGKDNAGAEGVEGRLKLEVPPDLTGLAFDVAPHGPERQSDWSWIPEAPKIMLLDRHAIQTDYNSEHGSPGKVCSDEALPGAIKPRRQRG
jgi:hypothetical protein